MTPFVLTRRLHTEQPPFEPLPAHRYDTRLQINLTPDGRVLMDQVDMFGESYTHNSEGRSKDDA